MGKRSRLLERVSYAYGKIPQREYTQEELEKIRTWHDTRKENSQFTIDDITWNDMDMDTVYIAMNNTFSSCGEEVLYDMLRTPVFDEKTLNERERLITYFAGNKADRTELAADFAQIGRTRKYSLIQYIGHFKDMPLRPDWTHAVHMLLLAAAIVLAVMKPMLGILVFLCVMGYNMYTYYTGKTRIEPYYASLTAMAYMTDAAKKVIQHGSPEIEAYTDELKEHLKHVGKLSKMIVWLDNKQAGSGDILQLLLDYIRMITHYDFIVFNHMVKNVLNNEDRLLRMIELMGTMEAMISVASYRAAVPLYCTPEFTDEKDAGIELTDGYHPLISDPVVNSIHENRPVLLTGSNASGKSTFLRTVGLAAIMAQTVHTVHARGYKAGFYRIYSSMALTDSVESGDSYYITEIKSLKRIMDAKEGKYPVLCFIDEILRGTNTVERIAASAEILKSFEQAGVLTYAATHDIELTHMLESRYANYHFTEEINGDAIWFSYALNKGRSTTRNAIRLLSVMGYDEQVVKAAENTAEHFIEEGTWPAV